METDSYSPEKSDRYRDNKSVSEDIQDRSDDQVDLFSVKLESNRTMF